MAHPVYVDIYKYDKVKVNDCEMCAGLMKQQNNHCVNSQIMWLDFL